MVFLFSSGKDNEWRNRVVNALEKSQTSRKWDVWDSERIEPGQNWQVESLRALDKALLVIILVSENFLNSNLTASAEFKRIAELINAQSVRVIPVLISDCPWRQLPILTKIRIFPRNGTPLQSMSTDEINSAFIELEQLISKQIETIKGSSSSNTFSPKEEGPPDFDWGKVPSIPAPPFPLPMPKDFDRKQSLVFRDVRKTLSLMLNREKKGVVGIQGGLGTGKTTLAHAIGNDSIVKKRFSDGIFYVSATETDNLTEIVHRLIAEAYLKTSAASNEYYSLLIERNVLFIFDDAPRTKSQTSEIRRLSRFTRILATNLELSLLEDLDAEIYTLDDAPVAVANSESNWVEELSAGQLTINDLLSRTPAGASMDEADREAFWLGSYFAREEEGSDISSAHVFKGYILSASPGDGQSEKALSRAVRDDFAKRHGTVAFDAGSLWRELTYIPFRKPPLEELSPSFGKRKISSGLGQIILRSIALADQAGCKQPFSTRHLIICLLGPTEWKLDPVGSNEISRYPINLAHIRTLFRNWMKQWRTTDKASVIDTALGFDGRDKFNVPFQINYAAFAPDHAAFGKREIHNTPADALGVSRYADHLAQLISAKDTVMPLSVGLFGPWGSGKSHFIDLLRDRVAKLPSDDSKSFHNHIIQIQFNAWHYLDTNLWANLVCEIFDALFRESAGRGVSDQKVENLKKELAKQSALTEEAKEALKIAQDVRAKAQKSLQEKTLERVAQEQVTKDLFNDLIVLLQNQNELKSILDSISRSTGLPLLKSSFHDLESSVKEASTLVGRAKVLILITFTGEGWLSRSVLFASALSIPFILAAIGNSAWISQNFPSIKFSLEGIGGTLMYIASGLASVSAWIKTKGKFGSTVLEQLESAYQKVKELRKRSETKGDIAKAEQYLALKAQAEIEAQRALREAEEKVASIECELAELAPGRQLIRFLKERASTEDYRRHLGLVSLVRRDFEKLSNLLLQSRNVDDPELPKIDRIVLYIDDLDRCRPERVVEVLEAVHLLLAFPLFAVVVAVDPRWLRQSLLEQYQSLLGGLLPENEKDALDRPATPQDYLEKIFQVPFNLEPLEKSGFERLLASLMPLHELETSLEILVPDGIERKEEMLLATTESSQTVAPVKSSGKLDQITEIAAAITDGLQQSSESNSDYTRLSLTKREIDDLNRFQKLFKTPRAVKRFANTYCLIRVGISPDEWEGYLNPDGGIESYRVPMILLAVSAACPPIARPWLNWLLEAKPEKWGNLTGSIQELSSSQKSYKESWKELAKCLTEMKIDEWASPTPIALEKWVPKVARYSF